RWASPSRPRCFWWLWLMMGANLFLFAGYLLFCGLLGFGDWAALAQGTAPAAIWRPLALLVGGALYYGTLPALARRLPALAGDTRSARQRLTRLTLYPYLGAGSGAVTGTVPPGERVLIDGKLGPGEWSDARRVAASESVSLLFKRDAKYLYVAVQSA